MANSFVTRHQQNLITEPLPADKSQAMPAHTPTVARVMPGGMELKFGPQPGRRYPKGMKNQPWKSWLSKERPPARRKKKRSAIGALMG